MDYEKKVGLQNMLKEVCQAWWQPRSLLQFAVRRLSHAAAKKHDSFPDLKEPLYKNYFKILCRLIIF